VSKHRTFLGFTSVATTAIAVVVLARMMSAHMPFRTDRSSANPIERSARWWQAVYILGADCSCSRRVAEHLAQRANLEGLEERVVFVGADAATESKLAARGLPILRWTGEQVHRVYGARSAPLLVFVDPSGEIRYSGGFARRNDFRDGFQETRIWAELRQGHPVQPLLAYGCALPSSGGAAKLSSGTGVF